MWLQSSSATDTLKGQRGSPHVLWFEPRLGSDRVPRVRTIMVLAEPAEQSAELELELLDPQGHGPPIGRVLGESGGYRCDRLCSLFLAIRVDVSLCAHGIAFSLCPREPD